MSLVDRVKNICLTPQSEWTVIASEPSSPSGLITGYVVPLAAIGAIAGLIGGSIVGTTLPFVGTFRTPLVTGVVVAVFAFVMAIVGVYVLSLIINALAPNFGGEKDSLRALKIAVYSYTPLWVAGVLRILPALGVLVILAGLYGLYLLYLGLPRLMKCPEDKAIGYTAVVVVCAIVLSVVIAAVGATVAGIGMAGAGVLGRTSLGGGALGGSTGSGSSEVQFDPASPMGKLQDLGKKLEESNKKIEAAQKSGDQNAQVAAAMEGLGTLFGGGKHVDPIGIDQLKPFVPDTFAGLPKKSSSAEKTGVASLMVSKAEAVYGDDAAKRVTLEISDTGGASGLMGLASWVGVQGEKDDDSMTERTQKVNGRLVHQKTSKVGGTNEYSIVLGERFVVSASGSGVSSADLATAVTRLDLAKLEALKDTGVQQ